MDPAHRPGAAQFAQWNGATFALVRQQQDGRWRASVFPDGESHHDVGVLVATEALAKKMVERWTAVNHQRITARRRDPSFKGLGFMARKPVGTEDRS